MKKNNFSFAMAIFLIPTLGFAKPGVRICHGSSSPYVIEEDGKAIGGIWPSILDEAFSLAGMEYTLERLPRERCYLETTSEAPEIEMTAGRIYTDARAEQYWTIPVMQHYGVIFFSKEAFPDGIPSRSRDTTSSMLSDLNGYRLCGFNGWHYAYYRDTAGFGADWEPVLVDDIDGQNRFSAALRMVEADRCDAVEIPASAFLSVDETKGFLEKFSCFPLTQERSDLTYLMISRNSSRAEHLAAAMFQSLATMNEYRSVRDIIQDEFQVGSGFPGHITQCIQGGALAIVE